MKKCQQGFSLIELMIVVAIIGVLSAVAVPAYNNYKVRATMADGLSLASSAKFSLVEYRTENGGWPSAANLTLGAATPTASVANSGAGKITVTFNANAGTTLSAKKLTLSANEVGGIIQWDCKSDADTTAGIHPKGCAYNAAP